MKYVINIFFFAISLAAYGQTSLNGVQLNGVSIGDRFRDDKPQGLVAAYMSNIGVFLDGTSGTNVYAMTDLTGNGFDLKQYVPTNMVAYVSQFDTNTIPAVTFNTAPANSNLFMKCDSLGALFSGTDMPMTIIWALNSQLNNNSSTALGFGWSAATNTSASIVGPRVHNGALGLTYIHNSNTNSASTGINKNSGVTTVSTNIWFIYSVNYSGTNGTVWSNLNPGTLTALDQTTTTLDQFTVGMTRGTNGNRTAQGHGRFALGQLLLYTNCLSGTEMTNAINRANARLPQKVF